jgi:hypothetical protein
MKKFTVEQFQEDFDNLMERVENGESLMITSEYGDAVMLPYSQEIDDIVKIHTQHNDAC